MCVYSSAPAPFPRTSSWTNGGGGTFNAALKNVIYLLIPIQCVLYIDTPQRTRIHVARFQTYEIFFF